ncbi:MAG: adenylate/guanylate cyclase domain-containing response regulator [Leptospiraceae bacterium]|nr:adenylate/guanylate cyclase domain-containing response regulator [Leptospiraceae bacterium]MDW7975610.1 adenylate/guanylate cyclase domain-containing response regulator [Leptospiraceae bacterium]
MNTINNQKVYKILIIEDDVSQAELLKNFISMWGYQIYVEADGHEGLNAVHKYKPDLILLDIYLPSIPGLEILKEIRKIPEFDLIPIFVMSADTSEEIKIITLSNGANEFIGKPIKMADLIMKIQTALELLESRRTIDELNKKLEKEKQRLLRYFSADLVEKILNEEIPAELGGDIVESTIMFFDVRGSTTIAERMGPKNYANFISNLFSDLMDIIFNNQGSVNELLGDGLLATFGCPVPTFNDQFNALKTAIEIAEYIKGFNQYVTEKVDFGIGIASGKVFAGNIGSIRRMKYAVMGDPVNTASRIQDLTKETKNKILFDHHTFYLCNEKQNKLKLPQTNEIFVIKRVGSFLLKGKTEPTEIYSLLGYKKKTAKEIQEKTISLATN